MAIEGIKSYSNNFQNVQKLNFGHNVGNKLSNPFEKESKRVMSELRSQIKGIDLEIAYEEHETPYISAVATAKNTINAHRKGLLNIIGIATSPDINSEKLMTSEEKEALVMDTAQKALAEYHKKVKTNEHVKEKSDDVISTMIYGIADLFKKIFK